MKNVRMTICLVAVLFAGVANADLVAHWTFDEGSGNVVQDSTANANNGTVYNGSWASGVLNGALQFNGSSTNAAVPNSSSLNITGSITISAWIKMASIPVAYAGVVAKGYGSPSYALEFEPSTARLGFNLQDSSMYHMANSKPLAINTWYLVTGTYDMSQIKMYVNGELEGITNYSGTYLSNSGSLYMGSEWFGAGHYYNGLLDDLRIYNNALSQSEIRALVPEPATLLLLGLGTLMLNRKKRS